MLGAMDLRNYIKDPVRRANLAKAVGANPQYLWQAATGWRGRRPSAELARKIEDATCGIVTIAEMRPDLWGCRDKAA